MTAKMIECAECKHLFLPDRDSRVTPDSCCSRKCARIRQARGGIPSIADKKARVLDAVANAIDKEFGK